MTAKLIPAAIVALLLLAGCSATAAERPAPVPSETATPSPTPRAVPDVPIQSGNIEDVPVTQIVPPTRVQVPSIGLDMAIEPVGVLEGGIMELPVDPNIAGWYEYGADPARAAGSTVLAAHVDSYTYGLGPFAELKNLPIGTEIIVTTVDGAEHRYTLENVRNTNKKELPVDEVFDLTGPRKIVLVTCGGQYDSSRGSYVDNVIATAIPVA